MNLLEEKDTNNLIKCIAQIVIAFTAISSSLVTKDFSLSIAVGLFFGVSYLSLYIYSLEKQSDFLFLVTTNLNQEIEKLKYADSRKEVHKETPKE